jgi:tetratricopeptide (TPR) repeat protein
MCTGAECFIFIDPKRDQSGQRGPIVGTDPESSVDQRKMKVFLCHSSGDKPAVRELYRRLREDGFEPWLDEKDLVPGQAWKQAIEDAVSSSDAVVVCISRSSVTKEGYVNKELKFALDVADEKPEGTIFIIPARLEEAEAPRRLRELQMANLYQEDGYKTLVAALDKRGKTLSHMAPIRLISDPAGPVARERIRVQTPSTKGFRAVLDWGRSHVALVLMIIIVAPVSVFTYKLYLNQQQSEARAVQLNLDGLTKLRSFDFEDAETLLGNAVTADASNAIAHSNLAVACAERGKYTRAQTEAAKAYALRSRLSERERVWVEGVVSEVNWRMDKAIKSYLDGWTKFNDLEAGLRLARVQTLADQGANALQTLEALKRTPAISSDPRIAYESALAADSMNDFPREIDTLQNIVEGHEGEPQIVAVARSQKCWAQFRQGDLKDAEQECKQAIDIFDNRADSLGRARTLTRQSLILSAAGTSAGRQAALKLLNQALEIVRNHGAQIDEAGALQNRANLWINDRDYESARNDYAAASKIYADIGNTMEQAALDNNWAGVLISSCQYRQAEEKFESVRQVYLINNNEDGLAVATSNRGWMAYLLGDLSGAERDLVDAIRLSTQQKVRVDPNWLVTLGEIRMAQGNLQSAEKCFRGVDCSILSDKSDSGLTKIAVLPDALTDFALLEIERGNYPEAERIARANALQGPAKEAEDEGDALDVLVRALISGTSSGRLNEASDHIHRAQSLRITSCWLHIAITITAARVDARLRNFGLAREEIGSAIKEAKQSGLQGYELEARLVEGEIEYQAGQFTTSRSLLVSVRQESQRMGFVLIRNRTDDLIGKIAIATG